MEFNPHCPKFHCVMEMLLRSLKRQRHFPDVLWKTRNLLCMLSETDKPMLVKVYNQFVLNHTEVWLHFLYEMADDVVIQMVSERLDARVENGTVNDGEYKSTYEGLLTLHKLKEYFKTHSKKDVSHTFDILVGVFKMTKHIERDGKYGLAFYSPKTKEESQLKIRLV